jgi:hypothetical protein
MAIEIVVPISKGSTSSVSTETRQHPLSESSTVFSMQMRFVTTKTDTVVTEYRGLEEMGEASATSTTTDENNFSTTSYSWAKQGDACIYTKTKTEVTTTITRSGWFNVTGT